MNNQNYEDSESFEDIEDSEDSEDSEGSFLNIYDEFPHLNYDSKNNQNILISDIMTLIDATLVIVRIMKDNYFDLNSCDLGYEICCIWMLHIESELKKVQFCIQAKKKSNS